MMHLSPEDEGAVERLTLHLLQDAYVDLAEVLRAVEPEAADLLLTTIEQRFADVLAGLCRHRSEGESSRAIALAVGERLWDIVGRAHGLRRDAEAA